MLWANRKNDLTAIFEIKNIVYVIYASKLFRYYLYIKKRPNPKYKISSS